MKCVIPQIVWNSQQQMLSVDFDPSCRGEEGFYRLVTVGADSILLIWELRHHNTAKPELTCKMELTRHAAAVNVVRFSPDGQYIASGDDDALIAIWKNVETAEGEVRWTWEKFLRKHLGDVTDLSWSADSKYLVSSSVDNSAVCWDVKKGSAKHCWAEHSGFVQGASFDPLGKIAATIGNDRTLRLFDVDTGKVKHKVRKYSTNWFTKKTTADDQTPTIPENSPTSANGTNNTSDGTDSGQQQQQVLVNNNSKKPSGVSHHMFQDDSLATFCRRLTFSPHGEFLIVPGGCIPNDKQLESTTKNLLSEEDPSHLEAEKKKIKIKADKSAVVDHAVLLFCRNDWSVPCAVLPTGKSYSIACRFCPIYFRRGDNQDVYNNDLLHPVKKDDRRTFCAGKLRQSSNVEESEKLLLDAPYRAVYAVATNNTVMIGATDRLEPIAVVRNIHFARLTDLSWSPDGRVLVATSTDGYCSIITFEENELGPPFQDEIPDTPDPIILPIPLKEVKVKESKVKEPKMKEPKVKEPKVKEPKPKELKTNEIKIKGSKQKKQENNSILQYCQKPM